MHEKFNVDYRAIMQLRELAEEGIAGYRQANRLIGKLLKAVNDDTAIVNRSAYIETGVRNAWVIVRQERANNRIEPILLVNRSVHQGMTLH